LKFRVWGLGFRIQGVENSEFTALSFGFGFFDLEFGVQGSGFRVQGSDFFGL
jgi:hypothetical protein